MVDEVLHRGMTMAGRKAEQSVEGGPGMPTAVPAEYELVEVPPEVLLADAVQRDDDGYYYWVDFFGSRKRCVPPPRDAGLAKLPTNGVQLFDRV